MRSHDIEIYKKKHKMQPTFPIQVRYDFAEAVTKITHII